MTRRLLPIALVLLLTPPTTAFHNEGGSVGSRPELPREPIVETDFIPVDRAQRDVLRFADDTFDFGFDRLTEALDPVRDLLPEEPVTLYRDGIGQDPASGVLGPWDPFGHDVWTPTPSAARTDNWGFSSANRAGGEYALDASGLLLTPELDLRTGLRLNGRGVPEPWRRLEEALNDPLFVLEFRMRHNLGGDAVGLAGRDGVEVWVLNKAAHDALGSVPRGTLPVCGSGCTRISAFPVGVYSHSTVEALDGRPGFSGYSNWTRTVVDLTPWAEQRVWVGFLFASAEAPLEDYFSTPTYFNTSAPWFGFHLDDLALRAPAPPVNVQVHELDDPSRMLAGRNLPTLDWDQVIPVSASVRNTGGTVLDVRIRIRLKETATGAPVGEEHVLTVDGLGPGRAYRVEESFPALGRDAALTAEILAEPTGMAEATVEVETQDNAAERDFQILLVREVRINDLAREASSVARGSPFNMTATLENKGTREETVTVLARVFDVRDDYRDVTDQLLAEADRSRTYTLPAATSLPIRWQILTFLVGQYQLFVRTSDQPDFDPSEILPDVGVPLDVPHLDGAVSVDGRLDEDVWQQAAAHSLAFVGPGADRPVTMRAFHDGESLVLGFNVPDATQDDAQSGNEDRLELYLDDLGDRILVDGQEDGAIFGDQLSPVNLTSEDLEFDSVDLWWVREGSLGDQAARTFDALTGTGYTYEVRRPIADAQPAGLQVLPGGSVGFYARLRQVVVVDGEATSQNHSYPPGALVEDGQALSNERLDDEVETWARLRLAPLPNAALPPGDRRLGDRFGIGMGPPPAYMMETGDGCPGGWRSVGAVLIAGRGWDQWNCALYGPEGRVLWYEGMRPDSTCGNGPCMPYSNAVSFPRNAATIDSVLCSPPIQIPSASNPTLLLHHQFATEVKFRDAAIPDDGGTPLRSRIGVTGLAWVTAEILDGDEGEECESEVYLVPKGGYSTEANALPYADNRNFWKNWASSQEGGQPPVQFCDEGLVPPPPAGTPNCGWWAPTGRINGYRPTDDRYPVGSVFSGSPWRLDRIPLRGTQPAQVDGHGQWQSTRAVDLAGKTVRFLFHLARDRDARVDNLDPTDPENNPMKNLGWRIDALAVTEEPTAVLDGGLTGLRVATEAFDPSRIGLGPGTAIPLTVDIVNVGLEPLAGAGVRFVAVDLRAPGGPSLCQGSLPPGDTVSLGFPVKAGDAHTVSYSCRIPENATGATVAFRAELVLPDGDDLPLNDEVSLPALDVRSSPDLALSVSVTPVSASTEFVRNIRIRVQNRGNVPIESFTIQQAVSRGGLPAPGGAGLWTFTGPVPVGAERLLSELSATPPLELEDRFFRPTQSGDHALLVRLDVPDDIDTEDNIEQVTFRAMETLYENEFGTPPRARPGIVRGQLQFDPASAWAVQDDALAPSGGRVLRAGDPATGEIDPHTDASVLLPALDLTSARTASLVLRHDYELETGYDAARLEISTDGGDGWQTLSPRQGPESPRDPGAYSETGILGSGVLAREEGRGGAFTGASLDEETSSPRVVSEFPLDQVPDLQEETSFVAFDLQDLAARPGSNFVDPDGNRFFTGTGWKPEDAGVGEGWLVENITHNDPKPRSGSRMWWSGSFGNFTADHRERVQTALRVGLDLSDSRADPRRAVATWYDWRAGWLDRELLGDREGSGGEFRVFAETQAGARSELPQTLAEREPSGWSQREVDLTGFLGQSIILEFNYTSADLGEFSDENNEGWFLDDFSAAIFQLQDGQPVNPRPVHPLEGFEEMVSSGCAGAAPFLVRRSGNLGPGANEVSASCWSLVSRGAPRDGGWHLEEVAQGPGGAPLRAWRMASQDGQGYPHQTNSRLITPPVDLTQVAGSAARLQFSHRYEFEAVDTKSIDVPGETTPLDGAILPGDAGVVEVQVYDEATATYGPWQTLSNGPLPPRLVVRGSTASFTLVDVLSRSDLERTGYNALYERGSFRIESFGTITVPVGVGAPFSPLPGVCHLCSDTNAGTYLPFPVSPAFSGDSDGWQQADWDVSRFIGKKVRFAFHAWTNPRDTTNQTADLEGWTVTDIAVRGSVFRGQPVLVRLRAATDGTFLDGHWSVASIEVSGTLYGRKLALTGPDAGRIVRIPEAEEPRLSFGIENRGLAGRPDLAVAVRAIAVASQEPIEVELVQPLLDPVPENELDAAGVGSAWGPFDLTPMGTPNGRLSLGVRLIQPPVGQDVEVLVDLLEDVGPDVETNGTIMHHPRYRGVHDESAGTSRRSWLLRQENSLIPRILPPDEGTGPAIQVDPAPNGTVRLRSMIRNEGTVAGTFQDRWTVSHEAGVVDSPAPRSFALLPGEARTVEAQVQLPGPGLFTVELNITAENTTLGDDARLDFPFQESSILWFQEFNAPQLPPDWTPSGTDGAARFRIAPEHGALIWGVSPQDPGGYCDILPDACADSEGYEGLLRTGPIDLNLTRVPNHHAELTLYHSVSFMAGRDGGRLEASLVQPAGGGLWVPRPCQTSLGGEHWLPLEPEAGFLHNGLTDHDPIGAGGNPLGDGQPVFQGIRGDLSLPLSTRYTLESQARWCPGGDAASTPPVQSGGLPLVGEVIALRYHVGIQGSLGKPDRRGWAIDESSIGASSVALGPRSEDGLLELPLKRNLNKVFLLTLENRGPVQRTFQLGLEPTLPWAKLGSTNVTLKAGETGTVNLSVTIPESAPVGRHGLGVTVQSLEAYGARPVRDALPIVFDVDPLPKPNLVARLSVENPENIEAGTVVPVFALVTNNGLRESKAAPVRFEYEEISTGRVTHIETLGVPPLCASGFNNCHLEAQGVVAAEWAAPPPGQYRLHVLVDPFARLVEVTADDNADELNVTVRPLQVPDLRVERLDVENAAPDGLVEAGALLKVTAVVENVGPVPVSGAQARIFLGSVTLTEADLPLLVPGGKAQVSAVKVANAGGDGRLVLRAVAMSPLSVESNVENNELRRVLTVRTHDLRLTAAAVAIEGRPGETLTQVVSLRNAGNGVEKGNLRVIDAPPRWSTRLLPAAVSVPPGGTALAALVLKLPADAGGGETRFRVVMDADAVQASTNLTVRVANRSLAPKVSLPEARLETGSGVLNFSLAPASNVRETVILAATLGSPVQWNATRIDLLPGVPTHAPIPVRLAAETPPGPVTAGIVLSTPNGTWVQQTNLTVQIQPTLRGSVRWTHVTTERAAGDGLRTLVLKYELANQGNMAFRVAPNAGWPDAEVVDPRPAFEVVPGQTHRDVVRVRLLDPLPNPDGKIVFPIDAAGLPPRALELALPDLLHLSDLRLNALQAPSGLRAGRPARVLFTIENAGSIDSSPTLVHVLLDGVLAASAPLPALAPGQVHSGETTFLVPEGAHLLLVVADGNEQVLEIHEDNNGRARLLQVEDSGWLAGRATPGIGTVLALLVLACVGIVSLRRRRN